MPKAGARPILLVGFLQYSRVGREYESVLHRALPFQQA
jgi:hypothetical protein